MRRAIQYIPVILWILFLQSIAKNSEYLRVERTMKNKTGRVDEKKTLS